MIAHVNGIDLFYDLLGQGTPLMLMHGGMGFDHTCFRPWLDPLGETTRLIYYDHRGNGRSTRPTEFTGIDHATWADDAEALRKHLGHDRMVLFGHSCGGFVAIEYALRYGKRLAGLILCCTEPALDYPDIILANAKARSTPEQLQRVIKVFTAPLSSNDEYRADLEQLLPIYFKNYDPKIGAQLVNSMQLSFQALNHCSTTWFPAVNFHSQLKDITTPTLIIGGREDWLSPPAQAVERLHTGIPNSKLVILEDSGHWPFVEERERFITTISEWIAQLK